MPRLGLAVLLLCLASCGRRPGDPGDLSDSRIDTPRNDYDQPFWRDPQLIAGTAPEPGGWVDSDLYWKRGTVVRLPVDARYVDNWFTPVTCDDHTVAQMNSPIFEATVGGTKRWFLFNHLIQSRLFIPARADLLVYNGGAVIGLTGGARCDEGHPAYSHGNHFCVEVLGDDAYHYFNGTEEYEAQSQLPLYQSSCQNERGGSGLANPACPATAQ